MKTLIISDNPKGRTYRQVILLKRDVESINSKVKLISISENKVLIGKKKVNFNNDIALASIINEIINDDHYEIIVFSLTSKNITALFNQKFIDLLISLNAQIFLFGAMSKIKNVNAVNIHLYERRGVAKITPELKNDILEFIHAH